MNAAELWVKAERDAGIALALENLKCCTEIDTDPIEAVVKNPEKWLVVAKTCPNCKGKGKFPGASSKYRISYITCNICRGKGFVVDSTLDLEVEKPPLPDFETVMEEPMPCQTCLGTGKYNVGGPVVDMFVTCPHCNGTGVDLEGAVVSPATRFQMFQWWCLRQVENLTSGRIQPWWKGGKVRPHFIGMRVERVRK